MTVNPFFHLDDHLLIRRNHKVEVRPTANQCLVQYQTFRRIDGKIVVTEILIEQA